jgi:hypothetical protein
MKTDILISTLKPNNEFTGREPMQTLFKDVFKAEGPQGKGRPGFPAKVYGQVRRRIY